MIVSSPRIKIEIATSSTFGELFAMMFRRWIPAFAGMTLIGAGMMLSNNYEHWGTKRDMLI